MSTLMTCPRHYTLRTRTGHVIKFEPDVPTFVPDSVVHEALAVNILPVEGAVTPDFEDSATAPPRVDIGGLLRDALVLRAIDELVRENDSNNFDAGGRPKVATINALSGLALNANERAKYWDQYREMKSTGQTLPTHKALETVMEIQHLNTPKEVAEYAEALGVAESALKGHPLREQKQTLLAAAIKA